MILGPWAAFVLVACVAAVLVFGAWLLLRRR